jgi:hypothetical protein
MRGLLVVKTLAFIVAGTVALGRGVFSSDPPAGRIAAVLIGIGFIAWGSNRFLYWHRRGWWNDDWDQARPYGE